MPTDRIGYIGDGTGELFARYLNITGIAFSSSVTLFVDVVAGKGAAG